MEGIPPEDLKDHEKQKNGNRSDSDDDEPTAKKLKPETGLPPQLMMPNMVPGMGQFPMGPMAMVNPYLPMLPPHMMGAPPRPLFPAAATSAMSAQAKPTFPAYSNATISAPPTTNLGNLGSSNSSNNSDSKSSKDTSNSTNTNSNDNTQKPSTVPSTGTASKIMHPSEDVSLEEMRARRPHYKISKQIVVSSPQSSASISATNTPTSIASSIAHKYNESKLVAAQEVFQHVNMTIFLLFLN